MEIYYMYTKTRKDFGRHARFDDEPSEVGDARVRRHSRRYVLASFCFFCLRDFCFFFFLVRAERWRGQTIQLMKPTFSIPVHPTSLCPQVVSDIRPEPELKADFIERNPVTTTVQVAPELSEHEVRRAITGTPRALHAWSRFFFSFHGFVCNPFWVCKMRVAMV